MSLSETSKHNLTFIIAAVIFFIFATGLAAPADVQADLEPIILD